MTPRRHIPLIGALAVLGWLLVGLLLPVPVFAQDAETSTSTESQAQEAQAEEQTSVDEGPPPDTTPPEIEWRDERVEEAVDGSGASVEYDEPAAWDDEDGSVGVWCEPGSGEWFGLGETWVTCYAEDSAGNDAEPTGFNVRVVDTTAPTIDGRDDLVVVTHDLDGRTVEFETPDAHDRVDGTFNANCDIDSGDWLSVGEHVVTCYAEDERGNEAAPKDFVVVVDFEDIDAPELYDRDNLSLPANDGAGRSVDFDLPAAEDNADDDPDVSCDWDPGDRFPMGDTEVVCYAEDNAGNDADPISFVVEIYDDGAPTIEEPDDISVRASSDAGESVSFDRPDAWDEVDDDVGVSCDADSGQRFPVGETRVTCWAEDDSGNEADAVSFIVTVRPPPTPEPTAEPTERPTEKPTEDPTEEPTEAEPGNGDGGSDNEPTATATAKPQETVAAPGKTPTPKATAVPTNAAATPTSTAQAPPPPSGEEAAPGTEPAVPTPTAPAGVLPWPPPDGFVMITGSGPLEGLTAIWGYLGYGVGQEFGHTRFSMSTAIYTYGRSYGLDGHMHTGLDIGMPVGTPLYSPVDGVVTVAGGTPYFTHYGNGNPGVGQLTIRVPGGHEVILGHMSLITVGVGQRIEAGQFVGLSGGSNSPHLHLETRERQRGGYLRIVDPRQSFLTGEFGTFRLQGLTLNGPVGAPLGQLVALTLLESTDAVMPEVDPGPVVTPTPKPTQPPIVVPPTPKPTQPPVVVQPTPKPTQPPVVVQPTNPNPPVVVRPNPVPRPQTPVVVRPVSPRQEVGPPVVVTSPAGRPTGPPVVTSPSVVTTAPGATGGATVVTTAPGATGGAAVVTTSPTVTTTDPTVTSATGAAVVTTEGAATVTTTTPAVATTGVQVAGVGPQLMAVSPNPNPLRVTTPRIATTPSLGEVNQPALATLGAPPLRLAGPTVVTTQPAVTTESAGTTAPVVVTTAPAATTPTVTTTQPTVTTQPSAPAQPTVTTTQPTVTTAPVEGAAPVVAVAQPAPAPAPAPAQAPTVDAGSGPGTRAHSPRPNSAPGPTALFAGPGLDLDAATPPDLAQPRTEYS